MTTATDTPAGHLISVHVERTPWGTFASWRRKSASGYLTHSVIATDGHSPATAAAVATLSACAQLPYGAHVTIRINHGRAADMIRNAIAADAPPPAISSGFVGNLFAHLTLPILKSAHEPHVVHVPHHQQRTADDLAACRARIPDNPHAAAQARSLRREFANACNAQDQTLRRLGKGDDQHGWACDTGTTPTHLYACITRSLYGGSPGEVIYRCSLERETVDGFLNHEVVGCLIAHFIARSKGDRNPVIFNDLQAAPRALARALARPGASPRFAPLLTRATRETLDLRYAPRNSTLALTVADKASRADRLPLRVDELTLLDVLQRFDYATMHDHEGAP